MMIIYIVVKNKEIAMSNSATFGENRVLRRNAHAPGAENSKAQINTPYTAVSGSSVLRAC